MSEPKIVRTVREMREALAEFPDDTGFIAHEPPWTGVLLVPDGGSGGKILIGSLWGTDEGKAYRASLAALKSPSPQDEHLNVKGSI